MRIRRRIKIISENFINSFNFLLKHSYSYFNVKIMKLPESIFGTVLKIVNYDSHIIEE